MQNHTPLPEPTAKSLCATCPWREAELSKGVRTRLGLQKADILAACRRCAESFADSSSHDCPTCPWNNPQKAQPYAKALLHCTTCIGWRGKNARKKAKPSQNPDAPQSHDGAMNCLACKWREAPTPVKRTKCLRCSLTFSSQSKVISSTNELSNKGQSFLSYDNHLPSKTDDGDVAALIRDDYKASRYGSPTTAAQDAKALSLRTSLHVSEGALEYVRRFVYELVELSDQQLCLFKALVRGISKSDFGRSHGMKPTSVNRIYNQLLASSPIFRNFIQLTNGSLRGRRGRHPKHDGFPFKQIDPQQPNAKGKKHNRNPRSDSPIGAFQQMFNFSSSFSPLDSQQQLNIGT